MIGIVKVAVYYNADKHALETQLEYTNAYKELDPVNRVLALQCLIDSASNVISKLEEENV